MSVNSIDGGKVTSPVPNDNPDPALSPRLVARRISPGRPLMLLRIATELGLGGLFLTIPVDFATGWYGVSPALDTGRSVKAGCVHCWRSGGALDKILTNAPASDPGVFPWKSGESGIFDLTPGLPTLTTIINTESE